MSEVLDIEINAAKEEVKLISNLLDRINKDPKLLENGNIRTSLTSCASKLDSSVKGARRPGGLTDSPYRGRVSRPSSVSLPRGIRPFPQLKKPPTGGKTKKRKASRRRSSRRRRKRSKSPRKRKR